MLVRKNTKPPNLHAVFILLSFISFVTFHTDVLAAPKQTLYEKYRDLGYQEQQQGNFNAALAYFSKAVSLGIEDPVVFNDMGVIYEQLGYLGKAEKYYGKALTIDPEYLPAYSNIAYLYLNNGFPDKAFPYFKKRHELSSLGDVWGERVKEEMLKIKPEYHAWIVHQEAEKLDRELQQKYHEDFVDKVNRSYEHYQKGRTYLKNEELEEALNQFNLALRLTPNNPKFVDAREEVKREISRRQMKSQMESALRQFEAGHSYSAKRELQKLLTNFPDEPLLNSK